MYAVIRSGGKQYRVGPGELIRVEKLAGEAGAAIAFDEVLMLGGEGALAVGAPLVAGAQVRGEIVAQTRAPKVLILRKKRRKNHRRKKGHRQELTLVRITEIAAPASAQAAPEAKAEPRAETEAAPAPKAKRKAKPEAEQEGEKKPARKRPSKAKPADEG